METSQPFEQKKQEIFKKNPLTNAFINGSADVRIWLKELYPNWQPIDNQLKEKLGDEWQLLITLPFLLKGLNPINIGNATIELLNPKNSQEVNISAVNYLLFMGYELNDNNTIQNLLPDILEQLEHRKFVSQNIGMRRALIGEFTQAIMKIGSGLRKATENPNQHPDTNKIIKDLLEKELGIIPTKLPK